MKRPVHTVKYMRAGYRKYQIFAFTCAFLTLCAIMLSAFSAVRVNHLRKSQISHESGLSNAQVVSIQKELTETRSNLENAIRQLNAEKEQISLMKSRIEDLERKLSEKSRTQLDAATPATAVAPRTRPGSDASAVMPPPLSPAKISQSEIPIEADRITTTPPAPRKDQEQVLHKPAVNVSVEKSEQPPLPSGASIGEISAPAPSAVVSEEVSTREPQQSSVQTTQVAEALPTDKPTPATAPPDEPPAAMSPQPSDPSENSALKDD
jgi:TolA-binding protein